MYLALFQCWNMSRFKNPISICRDEVMKISKVGSNATYHKCMKELHQLGYIRYVPSFNPFKGSMAYLFEFDSEYLLRHSPEEQQDNKQPGSGTATRTGDEQALVPSINNINNLNNLKHESHCSEHSGIKESGNQNSGTHEKRNHQTNYNREENDKANYKNDPTHPLPGKKKDIPPELPQVMKFFEAQNFPVLEAQRFYNYFQSNGWRVGGKSPMKDWHAAARNWMLNFERFNKADKRNINLTRQGGKNYGEPL
jgi:hypothetical protein